MTKRFVSWAAVSSLPQAKKISLDDQLKTNREHIERWDGEIVAELIVPGKSRSIVLFEEACAQIEAYQQLRTLIAQRAFDVLIFLDRSRLGRTASLTMTISELCERAGIVCYATESAPQNLDAEIPNIAQKLTEAFQSVMTREEIAKLMRRHEMGMKARVMRGDFPNTIPWGWHTTYTIEDDGKPRVNIELDEEAAQTIRTIFDLFLRKGMGSGAIAAFLRNAGHAPSNGDQWTKGTVWRVIRNVWRYAGVQELNKAKSSKRPYLRAKSKWPAIISEEDAQAVEDARTSRGQHYRPEGPLHRFSHMVFCGQCDKHMSASWGITRGRLDKSLVYKTETFKCRDRDGNIKHPNSHMSGKFIAAAMRNAINFVKDKRNRELVIGSRASQLEDIQNTIVQIEARISKNRQALQRADDQFVDGTMDMERYKRQVARIGEQWQVLQSELTAQHELLHKETFDEKRTQRLLEIADVGISMLESEDIPSANAWFLSHFRIEIHAHTEDRIRIFYL